jgi:translation initiation factor 2 alpha subunit (eIF-2alpha)
MKKLLQNQYLKIALIVVAIYAIFKFVKSTKSNIDNAAAALGVKDKTKEIIKELAQDNSTNPLRMSIVTSVYSVVKDSIEAIKNAWAFTTNDQNNVVNALNTLRTKDECIAVSTMYQNATGNSLKADCMKYLAKVPYPFINDSWSDLTTVVKNNLL